MSLASSIRRNSVFSFLSSAIRLFANILMFIGIARFYGPEVFGQFTTAHTLATVFLLFADFGLDIMLTTEIARNRSNATELFQRFFSIKLVVVLLAIIGMWIVPLVQQISGTTRWLLYIFSFYIAFTAITNFYFALFKGFEQLHHETKVSFINNLILLCALVIMGIIGVSIYIVALVFVGVRAIGLLTSYRIASRLLPDQSFRFNFKGWKEDRNQIIIFGLHLLFGNLYFVLDTILLAFWRGDHDVGIYQSAFRLISICFVIPEMIVNALMPVLSRFHGENQKNWDRIGKLMNKTLFFIGLPVALIFVIYADQIIYLVYGIKAFSEAIPILRIFGIIILIRFATETYALMLTTSLRQKKRMLVVFVATIFNYVLNLYAIPKYGPQGAALVSLATNILVGSGYIIASRLNRRMFIQWIIDPRCVIMTILTGIISFLLWEIRSFSIVYICPIVIIIYSLTIYFLGYTKDERILLFK